MENLERKGNCKKCGKCCDAVTIFTGKKLFKLFWLNKFLMKISLSHFKFDKIDEDGDMIFRCQWLKNNRCTNYENRPQICRDYPTLETYKNGRMIEGCGYYFKQVKNK